MSEKELLSKNTFISLFNMNELDRLEREDELFIEARKLGIEKRFKESLKKYKELLKNQNLKLKIENESRLTDNFNELKFLIFNSQFFILISTTIKLKRLNMYNTIMQREKITKNISKYVYLEYRLILRF